MSQNSFIIKDSMLELEYFHNDTTFFTSIKTISLHLIITNFLLKKIATIIFIMENVNGCLKGIGL